MTLFGTLFGDRVGADDANVASLKELEIVFLRTRKVYHADRFVVTLQVFVSLILDRDSCPSG